MTSINDKNNIQISEDMEVQLIRAAAADVDVLAAMLVSTDPEVAAGMLEGDAEGSEGRIRFLMKNRHGTPFEHNHFMFFVSAPIFVFREFQRHRIGFSYNEQSGRYSELPGKFWIPREDRPLVQVGKPGAYEYVKGSWEQYLDLVKELSDAYHDAYRRYQRLLDKGIAREVARACLPVALYSSMYVTCNARSMMSFLSLRTNEPSSMFPSKPMREIEEVARMMEEAFKEAMPITYNAFCDFGRVSP